MSTSILVRAIGCAVLTAAAIIGCGPTPSPSSRPSTASPALPMSPGPTATAGAAVDLSMIVFGPDDAPAGMIHDDTVTGLETATLVIVSGSDAEFEALDGFLDGRATFFSGDGGALLTLALAFDDSLNADLAAHAYQRELRRDDGYGFGAGERASFALDGICDTGANPAHNGLEESICIWHNGPVVLIVGGPQPMAQIQAIAEEINARVRE